MHVRILRWPEISENPITRSPRIFSKGHLPVCINAAWATKFFIQRTCIWPENITSDWNVKHMLPDNGPRFNLSCRPILGWWWSGEGWWGAGWYWNNIYPGLEVHIGKKRILHNSTVQTKYTHVQWAKRKKNMKRRSDPYGKAMKKWTKE